MHEDLTIVAVDVKDVRFPTSLDGDGSDAMVSTRGSRFPCPTRPQSHSRVSPQHGDPDYSCAYTIVTTRSGRKGYGLTFTLGRGTEVVVEAVRAMSGTILHQNAETIFREFSSFWRALTSDGQIRWYVRAATVVGCLRT